MRQIAARQNVAPWCAIFRCRLGLSLKFTQLALQRAAMHFECTCSLRYVAVMLVQHALQVFGFLLTRERPGQKQVSLCLRLVSEGCDHFVGVGGFGQKLDGSQPHRIHRRGDRSISAQHHNTRIRFDTMQKIDQHHAGGTGKFEIKHGIFWLHIMQQGQRLFRAVRAANSISASFQRMSQYITKSDVVVNKQERWGRYFYGLQDFRDTANFNVRQVLQ